MNHSDKYTVAGKEIIDDMIYGYVEVYKNQSFFAIADGWEVICGISKGKYSTPWVLVKRPYVKEESNNNRFEMLDL